MKRLAWLPIALTLVACNTIDDNRVPNMAVSINLADPGLWNQYGVHGFGDFKYFIRPLAQPSGFPFSASTYTGYGGILLISGMDPFTNDTNAPLAYDLSCPVENRPETRVAINSDTFQAVCPACGSCYDVTMAGGAPTAGIALTGTHKYGLRRYNVLRASFGGYIITN